MSNDDEVTLNEPVDDGALLRALMPGVTIRWDRWVDTCPVWPVGQYDDMAWAKEAAAAAKAEGRTNFIYWEPDEGEPHDVGTD